MDRETERTRNRLRQALINLMREKEFDEIKVKDLLEHGDVAIATFYRHYTNKLALLDDMIQHLPEFVDAIMYTSQVEISELLNPEAVPPILPVFQFIESEMTFIRHLLHAPQSYLVFTTILETMIKTATINAPELSMPEVEIIAGCMLGNIYQWVLMNKPYTAQELTEKLHWLTTYGLLVQRPNFADVREVIHHKINNQSGFNI